MKIVVVGTGYVGLVTGTCLAECGNEVACVDVDAAKVEALRAGRVPIYEPGLEELVRRNIAAERLRFTTDLAQAAPGATLLFIAVGTPQGDDGSADLTALYALVDALAEVLGPESMVVIKSTVPVGTNAAVRERLREACRREVEVISNPEFLKEGAAVEDFTRPDRVVVGVRSDAAAELMRELYAPFLRTEHPFLVMTPESAEMTKYVANAMLATKISFINEMANLCSRMGADVQQVRRGIGTDSRIGFAFLFPGAGYGGSCFPKDVRAMIAMARAVGLAPRMLEAVDAVNEAQKRTLGEMILSHFGETLAGKTIAIWGGAFKPRTDDVREAPSLVLIRTLLEHAAAVRLHDPEAMPNLRRVFGDRLTYCDRPYGTLEGADALAIVTEWNEFRHPDFEIVHRLLTTPVIFDGRNLYEPAAMAAHGFTYYSIGRPVATPATGD